MTDALRRRRWRAAALTVLVAWLLAVLVLNGTGHLSVDSLVQLAEGRSGVKTSFNPFFISVVFAKLAALGGPRVLVVVSTLMLFAALAALLPGVERPRLAGVAVLAAALAGPILIVYPGIVWKDVWFAHFALLGFALIKWRERIPWHAAEGGALLLFAAATLSRQGGALVAVCGTAALAWARRRDDADAGRSIRTASLFAAFGSRIAVLALLALALSTVARLGLRESTGGELSTGARILVLYDVAGIAAYAPDPDLSALSAHGFDTARLLAAARSTYSGERVDLLRRDWDYPIWALPAPTVAFIWLADIAAHPAAYLRHRAETFAWLLGLRDQAACAPVFVGHAAPEWVAKAGVTAAPSRFAVRLYFYSRRFVNTPYFSPLAWGLGSAAVLAFMAARRRFDPVIAGLQIAGLAYLAHFFFVSIACDFRYAYFSVLASTVGLVWLAAGGARQPDCEAAIAEAPRTAAPGGGRI